jgi:4-amino-4-deoxy-L-arabinose transferase-like glycosyltransferase
VRFAGGFGQRLALVMVGALAIRVLYVVLVADDIPVQGNDAFTFHVWGQSIASGHGFVAAQIPDPALARQPTAEHPPVFPLFLAGLVKLGLGSTLAERLVMSFVGTLTVGLIGLAGREVAGREVGLLAALMAAVYPFLWVADGSLYSETLYGALIAGLLLLSLRFVRRPSLGLATAVGLALGAAVLTRGEALLLVPMLAVPLALAAPVALRRRVVLAAVAVGATLLVLVPWTVRNLSTFDKPVLVSTDIGISLAGSNCGDAYHGNLLGIWKLGCIGPQPAGDESERAIVYRRRALRYARHHAGRLPVVMAVRFARAWDLYRPLQQATYEISEGRSLTASRLGLAMYYPLLALALGGVALLRRRGAPLAPLLVFPLAVSISAVLVHGMTRLRFAAEPSLVVLGAVSLHALAATARERIGRRPAREVVT